MPQSASCPGLSISPVYCLHNSVPDITRALLRFTFIPGIRVHRLLTQLLQGLQRQAVVLAVWETGEVAQMQRTSI